MDIKEKLKKVPKKWWFIGVLVLIAPYLLGITGIFAHGTWRYEMIVVVETPEGIKTGSAVRQLSDTDMFDIISFPHVTSSASFKGEAVVVDLEGRGYLFAVLAVDPYYEFYGMFPNPHGASTPKGINYYNWHVDREKKIYDPLKYPSYPTFVTFADISDPKSVQLVYKAELIGGGNYKVTDNTQDVLGEGVRIKEVSIQRTRKSLTWGKVNQYLPETYEEVIIKGWRNLNTKEKHRLVDLTRFKMERN